MSEPNPSPTKPHDPHDDLLPRRRPHRSTTKRLVYLSIGVALIVIGVALGPIPILQTWPLVIVGLVFLSMVDDRVRRGVNRFEKRFPDAMRRALRWARTKMRMSRQHRREAERARPKQPRPKREPPGSLE